ncbi:MAG TPA: hypothetical protein DCG08_03920 [Dialister sp.]|nr:hypothetical protein [Dialister sp.]
MLKVVNNAISLTRGDTATFRLEIKNQDGTPYDIQAEDQVLFTIKKSTKDTDVIIQKAAINNRITIAAKETESLAYGTYYYDVELRRPDGLVATVIPPHVLRLTEEVTF